MSGSSTAASRGAAAKLDVPTFVVSAVAFGVPVAVPFANSVALIFLGVALIAVGAALFATTPKS